MPFYLKRLRRLREASCARSNTGAYNEDVFDVYVWVIGIGLLLSIIMPSRVNAQELRDRLAWQAPPALVADVLMRKAVDGRIADARCLKSRTDVLESSLVDRKGHLEGMREFLTSAADK